MRPARSTSAPEASPSIFASGDAATPAAQITVCAWMRSVPSGVLTSRPLKSTSVARRPMRNSTPMCSSSLRPLPDRFSPKLASGVSPPSTRMTVVVLGALGLVVAEVGRAPAGGDDEAVVGDLHVFADGIERVDRARVEIEAGDLGELDATVARVARDVAQCRSDLTLGQDAGRDLVQERLE